MSNTTGEVFTRRWVVEFMLDLAGYVGDVSRLRVIEPSIGAGAFAMPIVERIAKLHPDWNTLHGALRGYDINPDHVDTCKAAARTVLDAAGCPISDTLVNSWFQVKDFLLTGDLTASNSTQADLVIGNPPYIRMENLNSSLLHSYRNVCSTMKGRADIFVGFFERGLDALRPGGRLIYICADRWMRNSYGKDLRAKIAADFSVDDVLVMHEADAFEEKVSAYPAIVNIRKGCQGKVNVATANPSFASAGARRFLEWQRTSAEAYQDDDFSGARMEHWHSTSAVWPDGSPAVLQWLSKLENMPVIEENAVHIGIGIATGADQIYIQKHADVEDDRLVPMVTPRAIKGAKFSWTGEHLVSPWQGRNLVDLERYPKLKHYYSSNYQRLSARNVAKRSNYWWRTIDSFNPALMERDLIVMQDMKLHAHPVRVPTGFYPHHGLTWFASDVWDLGVLGGLLLSEPIEKQVAAHCVRMRGGTLRFQPTVMRTVRLPLLSTIPADIASELSQAFATHDRARADAAAWQLYPQMES
ncbi:Eco57I restriction-modification methylase domain-containing protein [Mobiluncus mulieris]|uniref:Eco57I restriction-modification methylase domain-containing protein n=1 Tax=Mobiluncus mulieris TaxID=2052 RepID=UPI00242C584B|nr:Eco57I restriction-modification methylase domain-containing protein [Mobiluncus mulieris]